MTDSKNALGSGDIYEPAQSSYQSIRLQAKLEIQEVLCFAPVWNSTDWANKTFTLDVHGIKLCIITQLQLTCLSSNCHQLIR
jgi:hypothetical protein